MIIILALYGKRGQNVKFNDFDRSFRYFDSIDTDIWVALQNTGEKRTVVFDIHR